ncbi:hypothetical protein H4582DRAFT_465473 [Lactarius indigo]|nr:hypothetical protein H4582DRAFT_465473 [Lactarius indigo]
MTDWKSPAVVTAEYFAILKLYYALWGVLLWEFVVNIGFEYSVFTGKRKFRLVVFALFGCPVVPFSLRHYYSRGTRPSEAGQLPGPSHLCLLVFISLVSLCRCPGRAAHCSDMEAKQDRHIDCCRCVACRCWYPHSQYVCSSFGLPHISNMQHGIARSVIIIVRGAWSESLGGDFCRVTNTPENQSQLSCLVRR